MPRDTDLVLIRHAPAQTGGRLAGRRDVPATLPAAPALAALRVAIGRPDRVVTSPALRCRQTAQALFGDAAFDMDARLQEQDFGAWEGADPTTLPDPGPLSRADLARLRPPGGESFGDLHARTVPALESLCTGGRVVVVAHAGTVRAALSLALGIEDAGLAFEIAPLSLTHLRGFGNGQWAIATVNHVVAPQAAETPPTATASSAISSASAHR